MIDTSFLKLLDKFQLILRKKITSNYAGARESPAYGRGLVFKDYKEYVLGDDFRLIDWKVYGRSEKLNIKRFEEERNMTVRIVLDASASMNYGEKIKKFDYASMIAIGFLYMALKNNERFELTTFSDKLIPFRQKKGTKQLLDIIHYLNNLKISGKSNFKYSLEQYKQFINSKSLIVIISDFLFDAQELKDILIKYRRSDVIVVQVLDPSEKELPVTGDMILKDAETETSLRTFVSQRLKTKYQSKLDEHIHHLHDICFETKTKFFSIATDTPIFDTFFKILSVK